jgi:hypothetical protein
VAKEEPIEFPLVFTGIEAGARGLSGIGTQFSKLAGDAGRFDKAIQDAIAKEANALNRTAAQALVRHQLGLEANVRGANSLRTSIDRLAVATTSQARATQVAVSASSRLYDNAHRLTPTFSAVGAAISQVNPVLGGFATAIGRAGGAMAGITSVLGGPWGKAIGLGVAAVGLFTASLRSNKEAAEDAAKALQEMAEAGMAADQAARDAFARSPAGVARRMAEQRATEAQRRPFLQQQLNEVVGYGQRSQASYEAEAAQNEKEFEDALRRAGGAPESRGGGGDDAALKRGRAENEALMGGVAARIQADKNAKAANTPISAVDRSALGFGNQAKSNLEAFKAAEELKRDEINRTAEVHARAMRAQEEQQRALGQVGRETYETFGAAGIKALQGLAKGQKITGKQVLGAIGDELVGKGTVWLFEGIARGFSSYGLDPTATALIGTGTAAIAAGVGMGAASAGGGKGAGGGGGGRPAATPIAASRETGARAPSVVHVHLETLTTPTDEDAERIARVMRRGVSSGRVASDWAG